MAPIHATGVRSYDSNRLCLGALRQPSFEMPGATVGGEPCFPDKRRDVQSREANQPASFLVLGSGIEATRDRAASP